MNIFTPYSVYGQSQTYHWSPKHLRCEIHRHYTGIDPVPIYSFGGIYTTDNPYETKRDEILLFSNKLHAPLFFLVWKKRQKRSRLYTFAKYILDTHWLS